MTLLVLNKLTLFPKKMVSHFRFNTLGLLLVDQDKKIVVCSVKLNRGHELLTFIFIHVHTFSLFIHYCTTGNDKKLMKMYEIKV